MYVCHRAHWSYKKKSATHSSRRANTEVCGSSNIMIYYSLKQNALMGGSSIFFIPHGMHNEPNLKCYYASACPSNTYRAEENWRNGAAETSSSHVGISEVDRELFKFFLDSLHKYLLRRNSFASSWTRNNLPFPRAFTMCSLTQMTFSKVCQLFT